MFTNLKPSIIFIILIAFSLSFLPGCTDNDRDKVLKHANKAYVSIRLIVTDPAISPLIPEAVHEKLRRAETDYLAAVAVLEKVSFESDDGITAMDRLATCADVIIELLDNINLPSKYEKKVAAIRVVVKVLRIQLE